MDDTSVNVNDIIKEIGIIFDTAAMKFFEIKGVKKKFRKKIGKPWYTRSWAEKKLA